MVDNENCFHLEMIDVESILSLDSPLGLPPPVSIPVAGGFFSSVMLLRHSHQQ
jgi:hypothetical protein